MADSLDEIEKTFQDEMSGLNISKKDKTEILVGEILQELLRKKEQMKKMKKFCVTVNTDIRREEELLMIMSRLEKSLKSQDLDDFITLGHDGGDGFYNTENKSYCNRAAYHNEENSGYGGYTNPGKAIEKISIFFNYEEPPCPCCRHGSPSIVGQFGVGRKAYSLGKFRASCCDLIFSVNHEYVPYFGSDFPTCSGCEDYGQVEFSSSYENCDNSYDSNQSVDNKGCHPFYCCGDDCEGSGHIKPNGEMASHYEDDDDDDDDDWD